MNKLTKEEKEFYIRGGGNHCPFCGSIDIEGGHSEADSGFFCQDVTCLSCHKEWQDIYTLTDIETQ